MTKLTGLSNTNDANPTLKINETVISVADKKIPKTSTNLKQPCKPWYNDDSEKSQKRPKDSLHWTLSAIFASSEPNPEEY